ncbi:transcription initiation factor Ia RRN3 like protein [Babesia gibsoni]|uniref:Transcription initiation factor Ia RRN3 like protein n=1 Tax=Babesia gibsoni TaxID=33632 RepID=A0AAD8LJS8_BABGI|nr:transcription initiation factor Ia RRN3 like protein [Babesia gibsoni]
MSSYLSQLRRLKLQPAPAARNGGAHPAKAKDNYHVLRELADIISLKSVNDEQLKRFLHLFSEEFNWLSATVNEARQCENAFIELVIADNNVLNNAIQMLLPHFRDLNKTTSKIQIGGATFDNVVELKKRLRQILVETELGVNLEGKDLELVTAVLKHDPDHIAQIDDVASIIVSMHTRTGYRSLRCFCYKTKDGRKVEFSYIRCAEHVRKLNGGYMEAIRRIIVELCKLYPRVIGTVAESLESVYPHYNIAIEQHTAVTVSLLYLARNLPTLRPVVYRLLLKKMTIIDAEIKNANPLAIDENRMNYLKSEALKDIAKKINEGEIDSSEAKALMENPNWFKEAFEDCQTEEEVDGMTQKLDQLMYIMLEELTAVLMANVNTPANDNLNKLQSTTDDDGASSSDSDVESEIDGSQYDSSACHSDVGEVKREYMGYTPVAGKASQGTYGKYVPTYGNNRVKSEQQREAQVVTVADVMVSELFDIFEDIVLPTLKCKYVPFLYMHIISLKTSWAHLFLQRMLLILYDEESNSMYRKSAASYIASMVCRASFIQGPVVCSVVYYLFSMLSRFDYLITNCVDSTTSSVTSDFTPRSRNRFGESSSEKSATKLGRFYSLMQDILRVLCYHARTLGDSPRCVCYLQECSNSVSAYVDCSLQPISKMKQSVVDDAIKATSKVPNLAKLHLCLVRGKENISAFDALKQSLTISSSANSWFPFDSFPLYHSGRFISKIYREGPNFDEYPLPSNIVIKKERDSAPTSVMNKFTKTAQQNVIQSIVEDHVARIYKTENGTNHGDLPIVKIERNGITDSDKGSENTKENNSGTNKTNDEVTVKHTEPPTLDSSTFSNQGMALNDCPPIIEDVTHYQKQTSGTQSSVDSSSGRSAMGAMRARLYEKQRQMRRQCIADVDSDYDFWGVNYATEDSSTYEKECDLEESGSSKRVKVEDSDNGSIVRARNKVTLLDAATNRYENSDNSNLLVIGIDQLDDFELSLSSSILVNAPRRGTSRVLDLLTSTEAYKSAIVNSELTKNKYKQSRKID